MTTQTIQQSSSKRWAFLMLAVVVFLGSAVAYSQWPADSSDIPIGAQEPPAALKDAEFHEVFELIAQEISPSVVSIRALKPQFARVLGFPPFRDPWQEHFSLDPFFPRTPRGGLFQKDQGSGFVISEEGHILTNNHVVRGAEKISITLHDGRTFDGQLVGFDVKTDLAVLRIDAEGLKPVYLGDSDELRVGQWVAAIGSPFGLSSTLTSGIVSAKERAGVGVADYEAFLQTDAPINPGNSGGPLVDLQGGVVGVNTAIVSGGNGIGFAVPMNLARKIAVELISNGEVRRGFMGVQVQDLEQGLADSFGYPGEHGILISHVARNSPAEEAGIREGDILHLLDGKEVTDVSSFRLQVAMLEPGSRVEVEVFRDDTWRTHLVELGELRGTGNTIPGISGPGSGSHSSLGLTVQDQDAAIPGAPPEAGALVVEVDAQSIAHQAGIRRGDLILSVNGEATENAAAFLDVLERANLAKGIRMKIRNGDAIRYAFVQVIGNR